VPTLAHSEILPPKSWDEFEDIVADLYARLWEDPHTQRYGRDGQAQQGVDICGRPAHLNGIWAGIQCKRYAQSTLSLDIVKAEIDKAETFEPSLAEYLIATTDRRDAKLQKAVRLITQEREAARQFLVHIVFWEDLCSHLTHPDNRDLLQKHYPDLFPTLPPTLIDPSHWDAYLERYLQAVKARYGTIRIFGQPEPKPLEGIFTDLYILDKPAAWQRLDISQLQQDSLQSDAQRERINGLELVAQPEGHRLFILGKPGAGKTTFLRYLVLQAARGNIDGGPIFVSLKEWADSGLELIPFLAHQFAICDFPDAQPFIEHTLRDGRAIVLFDAFDEVTQTERNRLNITTTLKDFCDQCRESQVLITCRVAATEYQFERFKYVQVADFDDDQMRVFVTNWFSDDPTKGDRFRTEFAKPEHRGLRELGHTPLMLTLLCIVFDDLEEFPAKRASFYNEALNALLGRWDKSRGIRHDSIYRDLSPTRKHQLFAYIAHQTFEQGSYYIPQNVLEKHIADYLCALPDGPTRENIDTQPILRAVEAQHGILVECAHRVYSFAHLTFQEYYTVRYIVNNAEKGTIPCLLSHCTDERWREVILLTASLLNDTDIFFEYFLYALDDLVRGDEGLIAFLAWAARKAATVQADYRLVSLRSYYCCLAYAFTLDVIPARILVRTLGLGLALDGVIDRVQAPAFFRILDLTRPLDCDLDLTLDHALTFIIEGNHVLEGALTFALVRAQELGLDTLYRELSALVPPPEAAYPEEWHAFADRLQTIIIEHRDIGHNWHFTKEQAHRLRRYFYAAELLVQCLNVANVSDRVAIEDSLLLPPELPKAD
jgi:hypothetical protein